MVWNKELKKEIPENWNVKNLYEIAKFTNGLACQKFRPTHEDKLPVIKIGEMHNCGFDENTEFVRADIPQQHIINDGDILFSWSASLEVMVWRFGKGGLNQHIFKVTPNNNWPKYFGYFKLLDYIDVFKSIANARKTTMGHITSDHLEQSKISLPCNYDIAEKFNNKVKPIFDRITELGAENCQLKKLRDFLLPLLMNGQVTLRG